MSQAFRDAYKFSYDRAETRNQNMLARQAGNMLASGDTAGARNVLLKNGQLDAGLKLDTELATTRENQAKALDRFTTGVGRMLDDPRFASDPEAAWQAAAPYAARLGITPEALERERGNFVKDPKTWVALTNEKAKQELIKGENGQLDVWDGQKLTTLRKGRAKPEMYGDYLYVPEDPDAPQPAATGTATTDTAGNAVPPPPPPPGGSYRDAIAGIESKGSGDYAARGPVTRTGDRAYGRYQVMGANIPQWTREALGRELTPEQFIASPEAQDAVFDAKFGQYVQQYGSPEEAASMWFTGKPQAQGANRRDQLGTSGASYVQRFSQAAGGGAPLQGGAGRDNLGGAPQVPGMRVVGRVKGGEQDKAPSGYRWNGQQLEYIPGGPADPSKVKAANSGQTFSQENQLRTQFGNLPPVKDLAQVRSQIGIIGTIAKKARDNPGSVTAQDDLALIFAFMKILDPNSVVREGEFANAQNTGGIPDRVWNAYNKALKGTRLNDHQRAEFFNTASTVMDSYNSSYADRADQYRGLAKGYDLNPEHIVAAPDRPKPKASAPAKAPAQKPAAGAVIRYDAQGNRIK